MIAKTKLEARYGTPMRGPIRVLAPLVVMPPVAARGGAGAEGSGLQRALAQVSERGGMGHLWATAASRNRAARTATEPPRGADSNCSRRRRSP